MKEDRRSIRRKFFSRAFAEYNRDQYIPTKVPGSEEECLITDANDLGDNRFYDPRTHQSFKYVISHSHQSSPQ